MLAGHGTPSATCARQLRPRHGGDCSPPQPPSRVCPHLGHTGHARGDLGVRMPLQEAYDVVGAQALGQCALHAVARERADKQVGQRAVEAAKLLQHAHLDARAGVRIHLSTGGAQEGADVGVRVACGGAESNRSNTSIRQPRRARAPC